MKTARMWTFTIGAALALLQGCYTAGELCEIGVFVACAGDDGCSGLQACGEDGKLGACECSEEASAGSTGPAMTTGTTAATTSPPSSGDTPGDESSEATNGEPEMTGTAESSGSPDPDCDALCGEDLCGLVDCEGASHFCKECDPGMKCQDNKCVPPCETRDVMFINTALPRELCFEGQEVTMITEMSIVSPDIDFKVEDSTFVPGMPVMRDVPYDIGTTITVRCKRTIQGTCPPPWDVSEVPGYSVGVFDKEVNIQPKNCDSIPVVGCD